MNARTLKRRLDRVTGADRSPPRAVVWLPANSRDLMVHDPHDVVRIFDPARERAARKAGLGASDAVEAARMTDDEVEAINAAGDEPGIIVDSTLNANAGVPDTEATP